MVGPEGSFKGGRLSSRGTSAQQLDMCLSETSRCDYVVLSDLSTAPPLAGVRVSPWELCVPLVQVGGQLKACFYPCTGKDVCVSFFFFFKLPPLVSETSQMTRRVWMNWGWLFASSRRCLSAELRRWCSFSQNKLWGLQICSTENEISSWFRVKSSL